MIQEKTELRFRYPEEAKEFSDRLERKLPLRKMTIKSPNTMAEKRELELVNGKKVNIDIDPCAVFDSDLF